MFYPKRKRLEYIYVDKILSRNAKRGSFYPKKKRQKRKKPKDHLASPKPLEAEGHFSS